MKLRWTVQIVMVVVLVAEAAVAAFLALVMYQLSEGAGAAWPGYLAVLVLVVAAIGAGVWRRATGGWQTLFSVAFALAVLINLILLGLGIALVQGSGAPLRAFVLLPLTYVALVVAQLVLDRRSPEIDDSVAVSPRR